MPVTERSREVGCTAGLSDLCAVGMLARCLTESSGRMSGVGLFCGTTRRGETALRDVRSPGLAEVSSLKEHDGQRDQCHRQPGEERPVAPVHAVDEWVAAQVVVEG